MTKPPPLSRAMFFYVWMSCLFLGLSFTNLVVLPTHDALAAHDSVALSTAVRGDFGFVALIAITLIVIALVFIPGKLRLQTVRRSLATRTDALAFTGRFNKDLKRTVRRIVELSDSGDTPGVSFALSATSEGLQFWSGVMHPRSFLKVPWSDFREVSVSYLDVSGRVVSTIAAQVETRGISANFAFAVAGEKFLGFLPRNETEIQRVVDQLNVLRAPGSSGFSKATSRSV